MGYRPMQFKAQKLITGINLNPEWIEGSLVHQTDYYGDPVDDYFIIDGTWTNDYDIGEPERVNPDTICQFTGLYDRKSRPIYENDIVYDLETGKYGYIVWCESHAAFCVCVDNMHYAFDVIRSKEELEVVGNMFQPTVMAGFKLR